MGNPGEESSPVALVTALRNTRFATCTLHWCALCTVHDAMCIQNCAHCMVYLALYTLHCTHQEGKTEL